MPVSNGPFRHRSKSVQRKVSIPPNWDVPAIFRQRMGDVAGHQRAMFADGHLLLVLHELPSTESPKRNLRLFWRAPEGTWNSDCFGNGISALQNHLSEYSKRVDQLDEMVSNACGADDYYLAVHAVAPLRRAAHNMHETLQNGREALVADRDLISCRNQAGTIERAADLVNEDAQHGLQYAIAKQVEQQATATHRLNMLAAFFFPVATFAAVFGMNLSHGMEQLLAPWLFWLVLAVGVAMGFIVHAFVSPRVRRGRRVDPFAHTNRDPTT